MAKKATTKAGAKPRAKSAAKPRAQRKSTAKLKAAPRKPRAASSSSSRNQSGPGAADAFVNLLQSPLVADLVAVAATAALAALAEQGFSGSNRTRAAGNAVKAAGKAAAAAVGRRLSVEIDEIRAATKAKAAKKA